MMLRRTSGWFVRYTLRQRACPLIRKAIGFAILIGGFAVIAVYLARRISAV
jgi:hypothetical protein